RLHGRGIGVRGGTTELAAHHVRGGAELLRGGLRRSGGPRLTLGSSALWCAGRQCRDPRRIAGALVGNPFSLFLRQLDHPWAIFVAGLVLALPVWWFALRNEQMLAFPLGAGARAPGWSVGEAL